MEPTIWEYSDTRQTPPPVIHPGQLMREYFPRTPQDPLVDVCPFCATALTDLTNSTTDLESGKQVTRIAICLACGWHSAVELIKRWGGGLIEYRLRGVSASLRDLNVASIDAPVEEVRRYLTAKYTARFEMHPRVFEEVVASVFRDLGYNAIVTGYTNDGGIDIILERNGERVGVQVKRYRSSIKVEHIRSLAGALVVQGMTKGVFVTTSSFQAGASSLQKNLALRGYRIELIDAARFLDALGMSNTRWYPDTFDASGLLEKLTPLIERDARQVDFEDYGTWWGGVFPEPSYSSVYGDDGAV